MDREKDRALIEDIPKEKLADFVFMHLRNMWAVDGFYYMFIEETYGTEVATEIDRRVWEVMGKIEARKIKKLFDITGDSLSDMINALRYSGWTIDLEDKEIEEKNGVGIIRNVKCRVQNTRINKGLGEFGCKPVRKGFLTSFAKEFNPDINLTCNVCPPDDHPDDLWCEWVFSLKE
ncbi:MAG: DUF6125 family protein [Thermoplasmatota archaeon]